MNNKLSKLYTSICVLSPLFVIYSFTYSSFTVLDTLIFLFYLLSIPSHIIQGRFKVHPIYLWVLFFVIIHALVDFSYNSDTKKFMRGMHLANYIFFLTLYNRTLFNENVAIKTVRRVAIVSTLFLFFQHITYSIIGIPVPGQIPLFQVDADYGQGIVSELGLNRFSSFFLEPSQYAMYILASLSLELFNKTRASLVVILILCLGSVISTSNTALAGMVLMLFMYIRKRGISINMLIFITLAIVVVLVVAHTFVEAFLLRVGDGDSFNNRFNGYNQIQALLSANPLWGIGFWSTEDMGDDYLPGWARLYVYFGLIGIFFYSIVYITLYRKISNKLMFLLALFFNFGGDTIFSVFYLFYSCFFVLKVDNKKSISPVPNKVIKNANTIL